MSTGLRGTLLRIGMLVFAIVVVIIVARMRRISLDDLGIRWPTFNEVALWLALYVALAVAQEALWRVFSLPQPESWIGKYGATTIALRAFAIVVLAPIAEELVFRGMLYHAIGQTSLGHLGAIVVPALLFALFHIEQGVVGLPFILLSGLFYGVARYATDSTLLTMVLHALGNTYAVYQRIR